MFVFFHLAILLMSIVIHEFAHGWAALELGDLTAKNLGRLTLNPIKHLDPIGSFVVPFLMYVTTGMAFGWAKPVPYNPYRLRDQKYGPAKVAFAGPAANLIIALVFGLALRFNLLYHLVPHEMADQMNDIFSFIVFLNILLAVFNLIPLPPLDGSKILFAFLPNFLGSFGAFLERFGMIFLVLFIFYAFGLIRPVIGLLYYLVVGRSLGT